MPTKREQYFLKTPTTNLSPFRLLDIKTFLVVASLDRRSTEEQEMNRFVVVGLVSDDTRSYKLMKLPFFGTTCY